MEEILLDYDYPFQGGYPDFTPRPETVTDLPPGPTRRWLEVLDAAVAVAGNSPPGRRAIRRAVGSAGPRRD